MSYALLLRVCCGPRKLGADFRSKCTTVVMITTISASCASLIAYVVVVVVVVRVVVVSHLLARLPYLSTRLLFETKLRH